MQDRYNVASLIESAVPEYNALRERDERLWREAMAHCSENKWRNEMLSSVRLAVQDSLEQRKYRIRWKHAAMWGWVLDVVLLGLLIHSVWTWGRV